MEAMSLRALQRQWTMLGERDPYWAILAEPGKENHGWDVEEFFFTGVREIDAVMEYLQRTCPPRERERALDFGCGAGRLTQALARHFLRVTGVDIAPPMIELAGKHNQWGERCRYVLNQRRDLAVLGAERFDLIYSNLTLQHMRPALSRGYVREMLRVLAPGGVLLFQLPSGRRGGGAGRRAVDFCYRHFWWLFRRPQTYQEMHGQDPNQVASWIAAAGARLVEMRGNDAAGPEWHSLNYLATRD